MAAGVELISHRHEAAEAMASFKTAAKLAVQHVMSSWHLFSEIDPFSKATKGIKESPMSKDAQ